MFWGQNSQTRKEYKNSGFSGNYLNPKMTPFFLKRVFFRIGEEVGFANCVFGKLCFAEHTIFILFSAKHRNCSKDTHTHIYIYIYIYRVKTWSKNSLFCVKTWSKFSQFFLFLFFKNFLLSARRMRFLRKTNQKQREKNTFFSSKLGPILLRNIPGPSFDATFLLIFGYF